jgi:hypothetical protein
MQNPSNGGQLSSAPGKIRTALGSSTITGLPHKLNVVAHKYRVIGGWWLICNTFMPIDNYTISVNLFDLSEFCQPFCSSQEDVLVKTFSDHLLVFHRQCRFSHINTKPLLCGLTQLFSFHPLHCSKN